MTVKERERKRGPECWLVGFCCFWRETISKTDRHRVSVLYSAVLQLFAQRFPDPLFISLSCLFSLVPTPLISQLRTGCSGSVFKGAGERERE